MDGSTQFELSHLRSSCQRASKPAAHLRPPAAGRVSRPGPTSSRPSRPGSPAPRSGESGQEAALVSHATTARVWGQPYALKRASFTMPTSHGGESGPRSPAGLPGLARSQSAIAGGRPVGAHRGRVAARRRHRPQRAHLASPTAGDCRVDIGIRVVKRPRLKRSELCANCVSRPRARSTYEGSPAPSCRPSPWKPPAPSGAVTRLSPSTPSNETLRIPGTRGAPAPLRWTPPRRHKPAQSRSRSAAKRAVLRRTCAAGQLAGEPEARRSDA